MEKSQIDGKLAEAVRIAARDFGEGIFSEERLIGILLDYLALQSFPGGEFIIRTLIKDGSLGRLASYVQNHKNNLDEYLCREAARLNTDYGFSKNYVTKVLASFCVGMGAELNTSLTNNTYVKQKNPTGAKGKLQTINTQKPHSELGSTQQTTSNSTRNLNPSLNKTNSKYIKNWNVFLFMAIVVIIIIALSILTIKEKYPTNNIEANAIEETKADCEDMDTIVTAPDDTLSKIMSSKKKIKPYPKGRYRGNDEYDAAYQEGYEDALYDRRFD